MHFKAWLAALIGACLSGSLGAAFPEDWNVSGYNALRAEHYDVSGDPTAAPYPHTGGQIYDEFNLDLSRRVSPYEFWEGHFSGLANASDYRSNERGGVLERARVVWEKGDAGVPYRLEAGDFYASLSPRIFQRALKGAQIEIQPGEPGRYSLQLFSGMTAPIYRQLDTDQEQASGVSWLLEDATLGGLHFNLVDIRKEATVTLGNYSQRTWGLGWSRVFQREGHELEAEAEWARFSGEHAATGVVKDDQGDALFLQLAGRAAPFDYRLRHNRHGAGFRPLGGAVSADQRSSEAHLGWLAGPGLQFRGRLLDARDNLSVNPLTTRTLGVSISGVSFAQVSTYLDLSQQSREDSNNTVDGVSRVVSISLGRAITPGVNLRGGLQWNGNKDQLTGSHAISRQAQAALDYAFAAGAWQGVLSPGLVIRRGAADQTDYNPTLRVALRRDAHELSASHSYYQQDAHFTGGIDSLTRQTAMNYAWSGRQHRFDLEANHYDRDPTPGATSSAWRVAATWTWRFERPAAGTGATAIPEIVADAGPPRLEALLPGGELAAAQRLLRQGGLPAALVSSGREVYEAALLDGLGMRQRLLLEHDGVHLERSALILDFPPAASAVDMASLYQRTAEALYKQLGAPERRLEEGEFGANLVADLLRGSFKRWIEWRTVSGVLRLGIPSRSDGPPRLEIVHARSFPAGSRWGVNLAD